MKEQPIGSGCLDTVVKRNSSDVDVNNAHTFYKGQTVQVYRDLSKEPIGSFVIAETNDKKRTLYFDDAPSDMRAGDYLVVDGMEKCPDLKWNESNQCWELPE